MIALPTETSPPTYMKMATIPEHDVRILQRARAELDLPLADVRQVDEKENHRQQHEDHAENQIWHLHRIRAVGIRLARNIEKSASRR